MISTTQMDYVLAVAREGNFRRAAVSCHVTQPTLSVQIQRLEGFLDTKIFDRNTSPVTPTRLGQQVIDQIKIARSEIEKIREIIANDSDIVEGELRIGVIPTVSPYLVPLFLAPLNQQYPDLELSISELTTENCLEALEKEDIDVAILATRENARKYLQDEIYREELLLYVNNNHKLSRKKKVSADELEHTDIWLLEDGHCLKDEVLKVCQFRKNRQDKPNNLDLKVGSLETLKCLVEENFGYTLLPQLATHRLALSNKATLKSLNSPPPKRRIFLTRKTNNVKLAAIEALKNKILASIPEDVRI